MSNAEVELDEESVENLVEFFRILDRSDHSFARHPCSVRVGDQQRGCESTCPLEVFMLAKTLIFSMIFPIALSAAEKDRKPILPELVLRAETVYVMFDPSSGTSVTGGDREARQAVEQALRKWGRFRVETYVSETQPPDLFIVIRTGGIKAKIGGTDPNDRPGTLSTDGGNINIGVSTGRAPVGKPSVGVGTDAPVDTLEVYLGGPSYSDPLNSAPVWRYAEKGSLSPPAITAVKAFKKVIEDADKQAAQRTKKP